MAEQKDAIIYGKHPVADAVANEKPLDKVWIQIGTGGETVSQLRRDCKTRNIPCQMVPKEKMNKITKENHQGVIAFLAMVGYQKMENLLPLAFEQETDPLVVILDGVTDVRNVGAIARSAEVLGANFMVIGKKNAARVNSEAMKASAGALNVIPVCRENSLMEVADYLKMSGFRILASDLKGRKQIQEMDFTGPVAIIMGSEDKGVNRMLLEKVDEKFIIPQAGQTDSLNVSVAAGIILYEVNRQRI
ncbi:MAG: 23S rRNA (guanosine(2251)-2'-O)-methyltransferase RlmB [Saprospiraceae bacterium]